MSNKQNSPYKNLLAGIEQLNANETQELYVPSAGRSLPFTPLTVKQQKLLLSGGVDVKVENMTYTNTLNSIVQENCKQSIDLKVYDRALLALQLRCKSNGDVLTVEHDDKKYQVDLSKHIKICTNTLTPPEDNFDVDCDSVRITCTYPTMKRDIEINKYFTKATQNKNKDQLELTDMIGNIYVHELVKFIDTIIIGDTAVSVHEMSTEQSIRVFESLPMSVSEKLAKKIKQVRKYESSCVESENLPDGVVIPTDVGLFTSGE